MITGWLVKIVLTVALVGFALVELGSPIVMRAQLDGIAHDVADQAGFELRTRGSAEEARAAAEKQAADNDAVLEEFTVEGEQVRVKVQKDAKSFLLKRFDVTKGWYDVHASATSEQGSP